MGISCQPIGDSSFLGFCFTKTDPSEFGIREQTVRNLAPRGYTMTAGQIVSNNSKIIESDMRELRTACAPTIGPNIGSRRLQPFIDLDVTAFG